ncbi:MAG: hypothetical protein VX498_02595 [Myxococcota bacterium]|nr:hypothetical protein [Myxococcota bacterium]
MRTETHLLIFRLFLLCVLVAPSLHCAREGDGEGPQACGDCTCNDTPVDDDDDSGVDDDDSGSDDDDSVEPPDVTTDLPACEGGVIAAFTDEEIQPPASNSEEYQVPSGDTLEAVEASILALMAGQGALAAAEVAVVGYELCRGEGNESGTALWRPLLPGTGRALFAWRATGARPLIVGVPHANFEALTLEEGVDMFDQLDARALVVTGTHRCANTELGGCDGSTSVCGSSAPYRISDMAHSVDTVYQVAHEVFADTFPEDTVLSLHGMAGDGISLSSGVSGPVAPDSMHAQLGTLLLLSFADADITSCNSFPGASVQQRLCGSTNVQGRHVNGSSEPCDTPAEEISGRFLHLEQDAEVRQNYDEIIEDLDELLP